MMVSQLMPEAIQKVIAIDELNWTEGQSNNKMISNNGLIVKFSGRLA